MGAEPLDRKFAAVLRRQPRLHGFAKRSYQSLNWLLRPDRTFVHALAPGLELVSPETWAGAPQWEGEHFFGYFDKSPWSADGRRFLLHGRGDAGRRGEVSILVLDAMAHERRIAATSAAWNYQQGAMLQWISIAGEEYVVFNDFDGDQLIARIITTAGEAVSRLPLPVQAIAPDGTTVAAFNSNRLTIHRPEYGYARLGANLPTTSEDDGVFLIDVATGRATRRVDLAGLSRRESRASMSGADHWLNHGLFSPDGRRLLFMHRWGSGGRQTSRLYVLDLDTDACDILIDEGLVSHYNWIDNRRIICYFRGPLGSRYYIIDTATAAAAPLGSDELTGLGDGHPTVAVTGDVIATDTYPDRHGIQRLVTFTLADPTLRHLGSFVHPPRFREANRCDLHPRWHPAGGLISFDSVMTGGRRCWILRGC